jgi:5'-3' exonuclease
MFVRSYIIDPSISTCGQPIGGVKGFLKSLQKTIREVGPDEVIICWDGSGGSLRRKQANKNYKEGRKPLRLNRNIKNLTEDEEIQNRTWQQFRIIEYLNSFPVVQLMFDGLEADDVIAYLVHMQNLKGTEKVIVSMDKDFIQLLDSETVLMRPIVNEILNEKKVVERYGIHPNNFALARAVAGDKSDNIEGIKGAGLATIAKRFPFLKEEKSHETKTLVDFCIGKKKKLKIHERIVEEGKKILDNYKLMQLYAPLVSPQTSEVILEKLQHPYRDFNKTNALGMMLEDGIGQFNWSDLFAHSKKISLENSVPF